ncbi:GntR family transcriptional regulator [Caldovatus sediminis]|uniref:GntR family transcriptional regulator n=1 Tax=Caldovatus sediminis TaxID=2041189 RepID=A0A8J2ZCY6_9PROT|nr:GntR family transcriptional regulator [Caldovatus sediminis]GGG39619.1 GntR family transcriptional regulator [Caldovatus sediminis]
MATLDAGRGGLAAQAYASIRGIVLEGEYAPGDAISENELADRLGMSRTPVREALRALARDRLLDLVPGRGYFLPRYSAADLRELFELREVLEGLAARGAALRASEGEIQALRQLSEIYDSCRDWRDRARHGAEFHARIAGAARNTRLTASLTGLAAQIALVRRSELRAFAGRGSEAAAEHRAILDAIAARDPDAAERAARAHVRRSHEGSLRAVIG